MRSLKSYILGFLLLLSCRCHAEGEKLSIVFDQSNLPYSDKHENPAGLDVEIAGEIANILGAELDRRWTNTLEDGLISPLLDAKEPVDFAVGAPLDPRAVEDTHRVGQEALYSIPYAAARYVAVTRKDAANLLSFADIGHDLIGVEVGSVAAYELPKHGYLVDLMGSQEKILDALSDGKLRYGLLWPNAGWQIEQNPKWRETLKIQSVKPDFSGLEWRIAAAVGPTRRELLPRIDAALLQLKKQNRIKPIYEKYKVPYFAPFEEEEKK
ncbi:transporter substrate-binding domain-containing protein [Candidatus Sumerlaeota bacterium]|nr:transporter substrate-binding domain-containing protein [Candidatus Sumerlaeota bacterium]